MDSNLLNFLFSLNMLHAVSDQIHFVFIEIYIYINGMVSFMCDCQIQLKWMILLDTVLAIIH